MPGPIVITALDRNGQDPLNLNTILWKVPIDSIVNGSLLTVESNHFAVLKSRGAILEVYETGQFTVTTPEHPLFGSFQRAFFQGQSPWQYEVIYINRSKLVSSFAGRALSLELAELHYDVDYYIHVDSKEDCLKLLQHMPISRGHIDTAEINQYCSPVVEQAVNQICQVTPLEQINEKIHDIVDLVKIHLSEFLSDYGIHLNTVKVLVSPQDERMRYLMSLKALGLSQEQIVKVYLTEQAIGQRLVSAPNIMAGTGFSIGGNPLLSVGDIESGKV
jgi:membrane protease subunit (stomatin/prohibitin family)